MKKLENNLDERQEQALLKIEHNGCWFAFWALLIVFMAEQFIFGFEWRIICGEGIVFMALAIYIAAACLKNGIWDRHLKANTKTNVIVSAIAAVAAAVLMAVLSAVRYPGHPIGSLAAGVWMAGFVFVLCFATLQISASAYKKKVAALEEEPEEEDLEIKA